MKKNSNNPDRSRRKMRDIKRKIGDYIPYFEQEVDRIERLFEYVGRRIGRTLNIFEDDSFENTISKDEKMIHHQAIRTLKYFYHYFVPSSRNNHRARLLHHTTLLSAIWIFILLTVSFRVIHRIDPSVLGISYSISVSDVFNLTNQKRVENGLPALRISQQLSSAAHQKANDMFLKNYWAHYAPDGTSPWFFIKGSGYEYIYAGENLAKGFTTSSSVVDAWMNSPSHKENILSDKYNEIGFAVVEGRLLGEETVLVVQMFGSSQSEYLASNSNINVEPIETSVSQLSPTTAVNPSLAGIEPTIFQQLTPPVEQTLPQATTNENDVKSQRSNYFDESIITRPLVNLLTVPRSVTLTILLFFLLALAIDFVIIERRKIPRIVGHNMDHIMLISFLILYILLVRGGLVL